MTMRVRILRGTALGGVGNDVHPGEIHDLPDGVAFRLIASGRAELAAEDVATEEPPAQVKRRGRPQKE